MAFYDSNEIREAAYLCSFQVEEIEPMQIIADILNTEEDLRYFCKINDIESPNTLMYVNYPSPIVSVLINTSTEMDTCLSRLHLTIIQLFK